MPASSAAAPIDEKEPEAAESGATTLPVQGLAAPRPPAFGTLESSGQNAGAGAGPGAVGASQQAAAKDLVRCMTLSSGVIVMLVIYGLLQERIMQVPYSGQLFESSVFLVFLNRIAAVVFAVIMARSQQESLTNEAPLWKYLIVSLANVYSSACQYEALKYVSFSVQMLGKSFKMLPVMLWGLVISGKKFSWIDWCVAVAVTGGVTEFLVTGPTESHASRAQHDNSSTKGLLYLLCFLVLDGLTSTMQEKLFTEHRTSKYNQMFYINGLSVSVSLVTLLLEGTFARAVTFYLQHPRFVLDTTVLSASAVGGQFFIYSLVGEFGALVFAATMNVRQVVSIIVSTIAYHHGVTIAQIGGLSLVFGALFLKSFTMLRPPSDAKLPIGGEALAKEEKLLCKNGADDGDLAKIGYGATTSSKV